MAVPRAFARAMVLLVLAGCGDSTGPSTSTPAGLWSFSFEGPLTNFGGTVIGTCHTDFVVKIEELPPAAAYQFEARVPITARPLCNGQPLQTVFPAYLMGIRQEGDQLIFLSDGVDVLLTATYRGNSMIGKVPNRTFEFIGSNFRANRLPGTTDPNERPAVIRVESGWPDLEVGDSLLLSAPVITGYNDKVTDPALVWSSSNPAFATVESRGEDLYAPIARVVGIKPGTVFIRARFGEIADSVQLTVLVPPASVELTGVPDSLIEPSFADVQAVAWDAAGKVLPGRRFVWSSSDSTVAEAGPAGGVIGVAAGLATITARAGAVSGSAQVKVLPGVKQLVISPPSGDLLIGESLQLGAVTRGADGAVLTGRPVTWTISSEFAGAFNVDGTGLVRSFRAGTGLVVAHAEQISTTFDLRLVMDAPLGGLTVGDAHSCGLTGSGHVYCSGQALRGQLGLAAGNTGGLAVPLTTSQTFASLAPSRGWHSCALTGAGAAYCWGYDSFGQLGQASVTPGAVVAVGGGLTFTSLAAGGEFTCGLTAAGAAWCWGANARGQLGTRTSDAAVHAAPAQVTGGHVFTSLAVGDATACGLTAAGAAWCWGSNQWGNLGLGTQDTGAHPDPVHAAPALTFDAIAVGALRTCGITAAGPVHCWGDNLLQPAEHDPSTGSVEISAGYDRFCARTGAGALGCWDSFGPIFAPSEPVTTFATGVLHACARLASSGKTVCWGEGADDRLGGYDLADQGVEVVGQP